MKLVLSVEPIRFPLTGIGRYTLELARHLAINPAVEELLLFSGDRFLEALPVPGDTASAGASAINRIKWWLAKNSVLLEVHRRRSARRRAAALSDVSDHLFHGPNFYLPPFAGRSVVTIHDLSIFTMPDHHPKERVDFMRKEIEFSLKHASMLITDSAYTKQEVADYFGWPLDKIHVVHLAGASEFKPRSISVSTPVLERYQLSYGGYTLYTGTIEPRKNLLRLLTAYEQMPLDARRAVPLVFVGFKGWKNDDVMARLATAQNEGWARYLGFVPADDLPVIFSGARLFAFPSLYEGFGLPVLEAMASGVPVVTSTSSSLPEVAGGAAALSAPEDIDAMAANLLRGVEDASWRADAIEKGLQQAAKFSWQRCAEETVAVYSKVLAM